jgi:hypothetical protein
MAGTPRVLVLNLNAHLRQDVLKLLIETLVASAPANLEEYARISTVVLRINANARKHGVVGVKQGICRDPLALGETGKLLLCMYDDVVEYGDICKFSQQSVEYEKNRFSPSLV